MQIKKIKGKYYKYAKTGVYPTHLDAYGKRLKSDYKVLFNSEKDRYELWLGVSIKPRRK